MAVVPFSSYSPKANRLLVDTNIMIQYADKSHKFNSAITKSIRVSMSKGVLFYYPDFCLREFREYFRKMYLKTYLVNYITTKSLGAKVDNLIKGFSTEINIRDRDFKFIRDVLEKENPGAGYKVWYKLCYDALVGNLNAIEAFIESNNFKIANLNDLTVYSTIRQSNLPTIKTEARYSEEYGLGTIDAALLDWYEKADGFDGLFTNDGDLLLAHASGAASNGMLYTTLSRY